jgi:uncharacterized protein
VIVLRRRALLAALALAGCASPPANLYTLAVEPGPTTPGGPATVRISPIGLAGYLDRNVIVLSDLGYRLNLAGNDFWAQSLSAMIGGVLAQELTQRLPGSTVYTEAGAITAEPDAVVEVNVQRFNADASGTVTLTAQVAVQRSRGSQPLATRVVSYSVKPTGSGTGELVAAMSRALSELADEIAGMLAQSAAAPKPPRRRPARARR